MLRERCQLFYSRVVIPNLGVSLLLLLQFFNSIMVLTCKLLETDPDLTTPINPMQILFARMFITYVLCLVYMGVTRLVENAPFGPPEQRGLLVLRGVLGFLGVFGLYYSLQYLTLLDAVLITFLIPIVTPFFAFLFLRERYSVLEGVCALVSLGGVVLVAKPDFLFGSKEPEAGESTSTTLRLAATAVGLIGVCGASSVYIVLRKIGTAAHPLISVSFFALTTCLVATVAILIVPLYSFQWPSLAYQWFLFLLIGASGFLMQFSLTAGLQREKAGKLSMMIYLSMVYALFWDFVIWHHLPGLLSILGTALIVVMSLVVIKFKPNTDSKLDLEQDGVKYHRTGDVPLDDFVISDDEDTN